MKKQNKEPDYIGGEGPLTKAEETALTAYFSQKKKKTKKATVRPKAKATIKKIISS